MTGHPNQALYRFYDATGALLYVGITCDPGRRFKEHRDKPWWLEVANVRVEHHPHRLSASRAERFAILNERPRYNKTWNSGPAYEPTVDHEGERDIDAQTNGNAVPDALIAEAQAEIAECHRLGVGLGIKWPVRTP